MDDISEPSLFPSNAKISLEALARGVRLYYTMAGCLCFCLHFYRPNWSREAMDRRSREGRPPPPAGRWRDLSFSRTAGLTEHDAILASERCDGRWHAGRVKDGHDKARFPVRPTFGIFMPVPRRKTSGEERRGSLMYAAGSKLLFPSTMGLYGRRCQVISSKILSQDSSLHRA